ncbi:MAG: hypothetical protein WB816_00045 [Methylocystis sp.]
MTYCLATSEASSFAAAPAIGFSPAISRPTDAWPRGARRPEPSMSTPDALEAEREPAWSGVRAHGSISGLFFLEGSKFASA